MGVREEQKRQKLQYMTEIEREHWQEGELLIAGMDEAGRGPLAGPVVAACVIMPPTDLILGVDDSKKLTQKRREELYEAILERCVAYSVGIVGQEMIDSVNILNATRMAFMQALEGMEVKPEQVYTDAMPLDCDIPCTSMVKGDARMYSIAAASIIAKVTRDNIMKQCAEQYPQYGFEQHKGYGTKAHYDAIEKYGVLPIHRRSFLKKILERQ